MSDVVRIISVICVTICLVASIAVYPDPKLWGSLVVILAGTIGIPLLIGYVQRGK